MDEQSRNTIFAVVLMMAVLFAWQYYAASNQPPVEQEPAPATEESGTPEPEGFGDSLDVAPPPVREPQRAEVEEAEGELTAKPERVPAQRITLKTPRMEVELVSDEARIASIKLLNYRQTLKKDSGPFDLLPDPQARLTTERVLIGDYDVLGKVDYRYEGPLKIELDEGEEITLPFTVTFPNGVVIEKTFLFRADSYLAELVYRGRGFSGLRNVEGGTFEVELTDTATAKTSMLSPAGQMDGPVAHLGGSLERYRPNDWSELSDEGGQAVRGQHVTGETVDWMAVSRDFFMVAVVPESEEPMTRFSIIGPEEGPFTMSAGTDWQGDGFDQPFTLYMGPKDRHELRAAGHDLVRVFEFGIFFSVASVVIPPMHWLLVHIHDYIIGNYGVAIIILTILIRLAVFPLTQKSMRSMKAMRELQPKMKALQERYKDDKQALQKHMMDLYSSHGVNPFSGCWPMLIQIPILIALYLTIMTTIELRHEPFVGYIRDLSAPETLFTVGTFPVRLLPLLMGVTMFFSQKMTPMQSTGDQQTEMIQKLMMRMMPAFLTFICCSLPSGLVLYWTSANLFQMGQQYLMEHTNIFDKDKKEKKATNPS